MANVAELMAEARSLDLFKPHGAFEVHCSNCHTRLSPMGDCPQCGLIGRPEAELERRAQAGAAGVERTLREAIAKRRAYKPVKEGRAT
ncbi:MAG: hypothetical protein A3G84_00340 [Chloroflexi bacterium RIFCSPLOWO2_12_FULL_71_12]|nr:MAG: hypothetical protein A3H36_09970 [Chloroflexi bacterium RIFCSPLOWO2_02_FULL_71_16]OGO73400.1 MAG: hypothetical protein A3G84_00340 [Chloroflexi bacterium RIFCSPLOWO2_12_FULL_71_12]